MAEVVLLHGAEQDLLELYLVLFEQSETRAEQFSRNVDRALAVLAQFPEIGRIFEGQFHRKLVPRFYEYGVFYSVEGSRVMVQAVLDLRQDPEQIRRRLEA